MRKLLFLSIVILVASCNNSGSDKVATGDEIKDSTAYQEYLTAYNDYLSCKRHRPTLTTAYINKEITVEEFQEKLEKNTKICQLKQQVCNIKWRILEAQFDKGKLTQEYRVDVVKNNDEDHGHGHDH